MTVRKKRKSTAAGTTHSNTFFYNGTKRRRERIDPTSEDEVEVGPSSGPGWHGANVSSEPGSSKQAVGQISTCTQRIPHDLQFLVIFTDPKSSNSQSTVGNRSNNRIDITSKGPREHHYAHSHKAGVKTCNKVGRHEQTRSTSSRCTKHTR